MESFNEIPFRDYTNELAASIVREMKGRGKDYVISVDEDQYINYLLDRFTIEPLKIYIDSEYIGTPYNTTETIEDDFYRRQTYKKEAYNFKVTYSYSGSSELFRIRPSARRLVSYDIDLDTWSKKVSFAFKLFNQDPQEFKRIKDSCFHDAFINLDGINLDVEKANNNLKGSIVRAFTELKKEYLKENNFFAAINIKVNPDTKSVFTAPTISKKNIPQPSIGKNKEFSSEPMMSKEMYSDVLQVIYDSGKNMEKKPALYEGKDEEGLRDQFLFVLETRYVGTTATGETFNRSGKTDIILKYAVDGSNLFVAECKIWHGAAEFLAAISQLFDRYLTWRDSKAALLVFVRNKEFSSVLQTITNEVKRHPYYQKEGVVRGESSFGYIFSLPQDKKKQVHFEVMAFHYDK